MANKVFLHARVRELLRKGIKHHKAGRLDSAESCYRRVLRTMPHCAEAIFCRGLVAQESGKYPESIELINEALALRPDETEWLNNLALSYLRQGDAERGLAVYRRVAELRPQDPQAYYRLGHAQEYLHTWGPAAAAYQRAIDLEPHCPDFYCGLGRVLHKAKNLEGAAQAYESAVRLRPLHSLFNDLGLVLVDLGQFGAALEAFRHALALKPESAETAGCLGYLFLRKGDLKSAVESYRCAVRLDSKLIMPLIRLGEALVTLGELDKARECFERVLALEPGAVEATWNIGLLHLREGNFSAGWKEYEARWKACQYDSRELGRPLWKGEPLEGARILLYHEQGLGDALQFVRYVPLVAGRGGQVILEAHPRLRRLFEQTEGASQVISRDEPLPEFSWQCPLLSLPLAFGTELGTIPARVPYVHPNPALVEAWRKWFAGKSVRVGIAWGGSPDHTRNQWRSMELVQLAPLLQTEGATFYSLQMGAPAEQMKLLPPSAGLIDLEAAQKDFADTAAIVANLDLVISVDTSVAHLAGAMGKPVWILLSYAADWRWLLEREDSPWYPTARLFRQTAPGVWADPVKRLAEALRRFVAGARAARP